MGKKLAMAILVFGFLSFPVAHSHAGIASQNKPCQKAYIGWKKKLGHKAFAVTPSTAVLAQACGFVSNAPSKVIAEREALKHCRRGTYTIGSTCYIMQSQ